jgi:hypothetical protein
MIELSSINKVCLINVQLTMHMELFHTVFFPSIDQIIN